MGKKKKPHPLDLLPFTAKRDGKELPKPTGDQWPRCFWHVHPTGDYKADCKTGQDYALAYLEFEENDVGGPGCLNMIVRDMPRELSGIEHSFLQMVCFQAKAGKGRARRIASFWEGAAA